MTLTAVPSEGCAFDQWSGDIGDNTSNSSSISILMDKNRTIFASFSGCAESLEITVDANLYSQGSNIINSSFGSVAWTATHNASLTTVNVTAVAAKGYRFAGWSGAMNGSDPVSSFATGSYEPLIARFSESSSSTLLWAITSIAVIVLILIAILIYRVMSGRKKRASAAPIETVVPLASTPPQGG